MENYVIVRNENDEEIKIEVILSFRLDEYNKEYIAYTINDDGNQENVAVFISEIDPKTKRITSVPVNQKETVMAVYEEARKIVLEAEE